MKQARGDDEPLTNSQIEAILAEEGAQPPEGDAAAPEPVLHRNEPAQGRFGKWLVWLVLAFIVTGLLQAMR